jgi:hypothetical protein
MLCSTHLPLLLPPPCPLQAYLISAGMDGLIKAWQVLEQSLPGMIVRPDAEYVFDKENPDDGGQQQQQQPQGGRRRVSGHMHTWLGRSISSSTCLSTVDGCVVCVSCMRIVWTQ